MERWELGKQSIGVQKARKVQGISGLPDDWDRERRKHVPRA